MRKKHAAFLGFVLDELDQFIIAAEAHVEIAVGAENHAVRAIWDVVANGFGVGQLNARFAIGRSARVQVLNGRDNVAFVLARSGRQFHARVARISHQRDAVVFVHFARQHAEGFLHQGQLVGGGHRTGNIHQEHQVRQRALFLGNLPPLQTEADQTMFRLPRANRDFGVDRKRIAIDGRSVIVMEVVDEFFNPHGIGGRALAMLNKPPDVGVRSGVHINRKRGKCLLALRADEVVLENRLVTFIPRRRGFFAFKIRCQLFIELFELFLFVGQPSPYCLRGWPRFGRQASRQKGPHSQACRHHPYRPCRHP